MKLIGALLARQPRRYALPGAQIGLGALIESLSSPGTDPFGYDLFQAAAVGSLGVWYFLVGGAKHLYLRLLSRLEVASAVGFQQSDAENRFLIG